jgi:hypothetical protein
VNLNEIKQVYPGNPILNTREMFATVLEFMENETQLNNLETRYLQIMGKRGNGVPYNRLVLDMLMMNFREVSQAHINQLDQALEYLNMKPIFWGQDLYLV